MEKKILRILSFLMIAIFAFGVMGLSISAEELDIPVIEEVTEEEMTEEIPEDEVVEVYADGNVAKIGETEYATLQAAINAAKSGDTIYLLSDVTFTSTISFAKNITVTVDGQGHKLISGVTSNLTIDVGSNCDVHFKNIELRKNHTTQNGYAYFHMSNGSITLGDNAVVGGSASQVMNQGNGGVVYVEGGTNAFFTLNGEGAKIEYVSGKWTNGSFGSSTKLEVNLLKGTIDNCTHGTALIGAQSSLVVNFGDVIITNSKNPTVNGTSIAKVNITGNGTLGTIKAPSSKIDFVKSFTYGPKATKYQGSDFTGSATIAVTDATYPESFANVESGMALTGVKAPDGLALSVDESGKLVCPAHVCAVGATGYDDLQKGINAVAANGTVSLIKDYERSSQVWINTGKTFTINGNGYTMTDTGNKENGNYWLIVQSNTHVTFENITLTQKNIGAWGATDGTCRRENGLSGISGKASMTLGDGAVVDGAAGANGGVCWLTGEGTFILDGEGAVIKNATTSYEHGILAAFASGGKIIIKNGTIENCKSSTGSIIKASGAGRTIEITGGKIINNTVAASRGAVWAVADGTLSISGNPIIKDNKNGANQRNIFVPDGTLIKITDNFTGEAGITTSYVQFATASKAGITGIEGFFTDGNTARKARYYVPGTKYANETAEATIKARNAGRELAIIIDCPFARCDAGQDFLKAGAPAANWNAATQSGKIVYLLRDIKIEDVANAGASGEYGPYHINLSSKDATFTYDGNGFEFKIYETNNGKNFSKKQHVFRLYNQVNVVMNNFVYDGSDIMGFVNAGWVSATNFGGNLTLDNCLIKNCTRGNGGAVANVSDGKIVIRNTIIENAASSNAGGALYVGTPKEASMKSELVIENSVIRNADGSGGGALRIQPGTEVTITGTTIENCEGSDGGAIRCDGTLVMSDSEIINCVSVGADTNGGGIMIWNAAAKVTLTDVVIDSCKGPASGGICVVNGTLELLGNSEIKNCTSDATKSGLMIMPAGIAKIGGNTKITSNKQNKTGVAANITNQGKLTLASDFKGNLGFSAPGTIEVEEGLTSFAKINTIFLDTDKTKYPNITSDGKIEWELIPTATVETDAGWYYKDNTFEEYALENPGVVRFLTTFTAAPSAGCVESYGTYALGADTTEIGNISSVKTLTDKHDEIAADKAYIVDVINIPAETDATIYGLSFVKLKNIDTPVYFDMASKKIDAEAKKLVAKVEA